MSHEIGVGTWVVVRDPDSVWHDQKCKILELRAGDMARVRFASIGVDDDVPLAALRIPVDGLNPDEQAESDAIDAKLRMLQVELDVAMVRAALDAAKRIPELPLPGEIVDVIQPLVKLAEFLGKVL